SRRARFEPVPLSELMIELGGSFALGLDSAFSIKDKTTARFVLSQVQGAVGRVQRAFRSLTPDPFAEALAFEVRLNGPVPEFLTNRIAAFQGALLRLQSFNQSGGGSGGALF
ncbi:MAG: hypothetical protein AAGF15_04780, partial [Pseudomonadota bacterium]